MIGSQKIDEVERYNCELECFHSADGPQTRRRWNCALPGYPSTRWQNAYEGPSVYMGRLPVYGQEAAELYDPLHPPENHSEGCPGAWYRCPFALSVLRYQRLLTDGGFSDNLFLSRTDDRLVIEATQYLETERLRYRNYCDRRIAEANRRG